jgi:hypothetical protein
MKCTKKIKNLYLYSTVSALIGTAVYVLVKYLLIKQFDWITTAVIAVFLWFGNFLSYKYLNRKNCR